MTHRALCFPLFAVLAIACGGSVDEPSSTRSPSGSADAVPGAADDASGTSEASKSKASDSAPAKPNLQLTLNNRSAQEVFVLRDGQSVPLWLEIDGGLQLSGYGLGWCDASDPKLHNEPQMVLQPIAPDSSKKFTWYGSSVSLGDECWQERPVAPGKHTARACVYDAHVNLVATAGAIPVGGTKPIDAPSKWFSAAPSRCIDFEFELPTSGTANVELDL